MYVYITIHFFKSRLCFFIVYGKSSSKLTFEYSYQACLTGCSVAKKRGLRYLIVCRALFTMYRAPFIVNRALMTGCSVVKK